MSPRQAPWSMLTRWLAIGVMAALTGCAGTPPPVWQLDVRQAVEQATAATLAGQTRVANAQWQRALQAAAATGRADVLAHVALSRCAIEQTALVWQGCTAAQPYLPDASSALQAYAAWLAWPEAPSSAPTVGALPPAHQPVAQRLLQGAPPGEMVLALQSVPDPLARLVAGSVAWRAGRLDAAGVAVLVDTASAQGWRRPLAVWLGVQARLADAAGDAEAAARARRRQAWVLRPEAPPTDQGR
jgi:hypothetical protein